MLEILLSNFFLFKCWVMDDKSEVSVGFYKGHVKIMSSLGNEAHEKYCVCVGYAKEGGSVCV